jgi:hypothetical protein
MERRERAYLAAGVGSMVPPELITSSLIFSIFCFSKRARRDGQRTKQSK